MTTRNGIRYCTSREIWAAVAIGLMVCAARATVAAEAVEYDWTGFTCRSELPLSDPDGLRRELLDLRRSVSELTALSFSGRSVSLHICSSRRRYISQVSPIAADARRQRGVYLRREGRPAIYTFEQRDLESILRHECVHALLHEALPYVPLWLDEGLASYFEAPAARRAHGHPYQSRVQWGVRLGWRPSLATLESIRRSDEMDVGDYRHAWAWVHFLLHESDASRQVLRDFLQQIADGGPPVRFSEFVSSRLPDSERRLVAHFNSWDR